MPSKAQILRTVADRLDGLFQAGVLQLPKGQRRAAAAVEMETDAQDVVTPVDERPLYSTVGEKPAAATMEPNTMTAKNASEQAAESKSQISAVAAACVSDAPAPTLEVLQARIAACTRCNELATTRTQTVFGGGNPKARLCFLGEAPGADEDKTGIPFVGRAGQLLTKIIEACRLQREDVYILNMLKCRPPGNRNPLPHELSNCRGYLENQLDLIQPEFICCLGAVAAQNLLGTTVPIGKLRGKIHTFRDIKVVCTYHPAYLLRSPSFKKETWEDMKMLLREMGVDL